MPDLPTARCKICQRLKEETNHWFVAVTVPDLEGVIYLPAEAAQTPRVPGLTYEDLCGQACSLKHHSRKLDDWAAAFQELAAQAATASEQVTEAA